MALFHKNIHSISPKNLETRYVTREACKEPSYDGTTLVLICTVLLQERAGAALTRRINRAWELKIKDAVQGADGWTRYRVARACLRWATRSFM